MFLRLNQSLQQETKLYPDISRTFATMIFMTVQKKILNNAEMMLAVNEGHRAFRRAAVTDDKLSNSVNLLKAGGGSIVAQQQ